MSSGPHHSLVKACKRPPPAMMAVDVGEMFICSKLKTGAKSFGNGSQDICKCYESGAIAEYPAQPFTCVGVL